MPSSIWLREWVTALAALILGCVLWGRFWAARGFAPGLDDSPQLWAATRARVGPRSTVILGTSRGQAAIDPKAWMEVRPDSQVFNLALEGRSPLRPLAELASDSGYRGLVVVDLIPFFTFDLTAWKNDVDETLAAYDRYRTSPAIRWEAALRRLVPAGVPFRHPSLRVEPILLDLFEGRLSTPPQFTTRSDRFRPFGWDYHDHPPPQSDYDFFRERAFPATVAERDSIIHLLASAVRAIQGHGGAVVFLRLPSCGQVYGFEEEFFPRQLFWDVARDSVPAPFLDRRDDATLSGESWKCTDGSHLFVGQSRSFTQAVVPLVMAAVGRRLEAQ